MAKAAKTEPAEKSEGAEKAKGGAMGLIVALVLATILAGGAGASYALFLQKKLLPQGATAGVTKKPPAAAVEVDPKSKDVSGVVALPPIITNLTAPAGTWIRLEASLVMEPLPAQEADILRNDVTEDVMAFLRTLSVHQLEGAMGLLHLKEDLNERIALRSKGKVRELVIHLMVLQ